jgi:hypothetical protein
MEAAGALANGGFRVPEAARADATLRCPKGRNDSDILSTDMTCG